MRTDPQRFWEKVEQNGDCWLWTTRIRPDGYANFSHNGRTIYAHRYAYELLVGAVPEGLTLDHLCRVRHCVNPAHLEPVTNRENTLRGEGLAAKNARRKHCPAGHFYDLVTNRKRRCKQCENKDARRRYWERKANAA